MPDQPRDPRTRVDDLLAENTRHPPGSVRERPGQSPSLATQTPGLDPQEPARLAGIRAVAWIRERPGVVLGVLGGLAAAGAGLWLALRRRASARRRATRGLRGAWLRLRARMA
jgi:hypothetical protein